MSYEPAPDALLLTIDETARRLGVTRGRILDLIANRYLELVSLGPRTHRITARSIEDYLHRLRVAGAPPLRVTVTSLHAAREHALSVEDSTVPGEPSGPSAR